MSHLPPLISQTIVDGHFLAPVILGLAMFAIPIVGILTRHQRKMAEIIHGRAHNDALRGELEAVKAEVSELRSQLRAALSAPVAVGGNESEELKQRLG